MELPRTFASRRALRRAAHAGFTLMELMVVVGIILIMTAMSIPAITKFLDGQSLHQSGRITQSAFNEARRASITQRSKNYLILFREPDPGRPGMFLYGMRRFREGVGYEGDLQYLLKGVQFDMVAPGGSSTDPPYVAGRLRGRMALPVFEGLPKPNDPSNDAFEKIINTQLKIETNFVGTGVQIGWLEFRKDGTIRPDNVTPSVPPIVAGSPLFDLNVPFDEVNDNLADAVDMNVREESETAEVDERCFIDVDMNTGRASFRVLRCSTTGASAGSTP